MTGLTCVKKDLNWAHALLKIAQLESIMWVGLPESIGLASLLSESLDEARVELLAQVVHDATVAVLLVVAIDVEHQGKLLHSGAQIERLPFTPTQLQSDEVTLAKYPVVIERVASFLSREGLWMNSELNDLLSKVVEEHVTHVLHLFFDVGLPLEAVSCRLRQDVKLDEVLIPGKETQSLKETRPADLRFLSWGQFDCFFLTRIFSDWLIFRFFLIVQLLSLYSDLLWRYCRRLGLFRLRRYFEPVYCARISGSFLSLW